MAAGDDGSAKAAHGLRCVRQYLFKTSGGKDLRTVKNGGGGGI